MKLHTLKVEDFSTPLSPLDRSFRQKLNREIGELTNVMTQKDLTDIYRIFHPNIKEFTFSASHGNVSKTDHILVNKANLKGYKKWLKIRNQ